MPDDNLNTPPDSSPIPPLDEFKPQSPSYNSWTSIAKIINDYNLNKSINLAILFIILFGVAVINTSWVLLPTAYVLIFELYSKRRAKKQVTNAILSLSSESKFKNTDSKK